MSTRPHGIVQVNQHSATSLSESDVQLPGPIQFCHLMLKLRVQRGDVVVDATLGNGHDTLFLADLVGPDGLVYSFDIQQIALDASQRNIVRAGYEQRVRLTKTGHENAVDFIDLYHRNRIKAVTFNLGYLPGGDKNITTKSTSTIQALNQLASALVPSGIIAVVLYTGHAGAEEEVRAVIDWTKKLNTTQFVATSYGFVNRPNNPPFAILVERIAGGV